METTIIGRGRSSFLPRRLLQWAAMGRSRGPVTARVVSGRWTLLFVYRTDYTHQVEYLWTGWFSIQTCETYELHKYYIPAVLWPKPNRQGHITSFRLQDFPETERQMVVQQRGLPIFKAGPGNSCQRWTNESKMSVIDCSLRDCSCWIWMDVIPFSQLT